MSTQSRSDKLLSDWAKTWTKENLSPETQKLIQQATFDLYYGPVKDGSFGDPACDDPDGEWSDYPGFTSATKQISEAIDDLPSALYIDEETGETREDPPQDEKCEPCDGEGKIALEDGEPGETIKCDACNGRGCFEPAGDWWHFVRMDLVRAIVGKELAEYT